MLAALTLLLLAFRGRLDKAHIALLYLLLVLGGTLRGGRRLGLALATAAFLLFNFFFLHPYGTFAVADPLDWLVLLTFLVVSTVAAEMLHRLQVQADVAERRAAEIDRFATLGAETLNVARSRRGTQRHRGSHPIHPGSAGVPDPSAGRTGAAADPLVTWVGENGQAAVRQGDGTIRLTDSPQPAHDRLEEAHAILLPLRVGDRTVGVLEIGQAHPIAFTPAQWRFLAALTYYAALGVERARLTAEADRAEVLREANRLKDALLASVSHDLRTPLTTIKALAHDLARIDDRAITIEEEADRLNRLVAALLDLSRLQGGALPLSIELNPVDDLVGALVQRVSGVLEGRDLHVSLDQGGTLLVGRFDFVHALRILVNLVENAHKYSPPATPIDLGVTRAGERLLFAVSDRGPGVRRGGARADLPAVLPAGRHPARCRRGRPRPRDRPPAGGGAGRDARRAPRSGGGSTFTLTLPAADLSAADLPSGLA